MPKGRFFQDAAVFSQTATCDRCDTVQQVIMSQGAWPAIKYFCVDWKACLERVEWPPKHGPKESGE